MRRNRSEPRNLPPVDHREDDRHRHESHDAYIDDIQRRIDVLSHYANQHLRRPESSYNASYTPQPDYERPYPNAHDNLPPPHQNASASLSARTDNLEDMHANLDRIGALLREMQHAPQSARVEHSEKSNRNNADFQTAPNDMSRAFAGYSARDNRTHADPMSLSTFVETSHNELRLQLADMQSVFDKNLAATNHEVDRLQEGQSNVLAAIDNVTKMIADNGPAFDSALRSDFYNIEMRLEEITRAVVAISHGGSANVDHMQRLEARISDLARTLEASQRRSVSSGQTDVLPAMAEDLSRLTEQVSVMNSQVDSADREIAAKIAALQDKLDNIVAATTSNFLEGAEPPSSELIERLDDLVALKQSGEMTASSIFELSEQLRDLEATFLETSKSEDFAEHFDRIERRLQGITDHLGDDENEKKYNEIIQLKLQSIEEQVANSRDVAIELASQVAEESVRNAIASVESRPESRQLLASREQLDELLTNMDRFQKNAARNDDQTQGAFEAVKHTLETISERLQVLEEVAHSLQDQQGVVSQSQEQQLSEHSTSPAVSSSPIEPSQEVSDTVDHNPDNGESHALDGDGTVPDSPTKLDSDDADQSFAPEHGRLMEAEAPALTTEPHNTIPSSDAEVSEEIPLEPGAKRPDLATLTKPGNEAGKSLSKSEEASGADFIAAARRAAQAAAENANTLQQEEDTESADNAEKKGLLTSLPNILARRKKTFALAIGGALLTAVAIPLAEKIVNNPPQLSLAENKALSDDISVADGKVEDKPDVEPKDVRVIEILLDPVITSSARIESDPQESRIQDPLNGKGKPALSGLPFKNSQLLAAIERGQNEALFEVGSRYMKGEGVEKSPVKAAEWFNLAAKNGFAPAQYMIGNFSEKGIGVERNVAAAAKWYKKAADGGNVVAMHNLAVLHASPIEDGASADAEKAFHWFMKAAQFGLTDSQVNLGILYAKGVGIKPDLVNAYKWFTVAAKAGDDDAGRKRDIVAKTMSKDQLAKARQAVKDWKPGRADESANRVTPRPEWAVGKANQLMSFDKTTIAKTQSMLSKLGYDSGSADGIMGQKTRDAIALFQQKMGLEVNGKITAEFLRQLESIAT